MALSCYQTFAPYQNITTYIEDAREHVPNLERGGFLYIWIHNIPVILSSHGRAFTETLLVDITQFLKKQILPEDMVVLLDKDHYGIVLEHCTHEEMDEKALAIFQALIHYECINTCALPLQLGVTIGGSDFSVPDDTAEDIINKAYIALHDAKALYRHYVRFSDQPLHIRTSQEEMAAGHYLQRALYDHKLRLAFQPIIDRTTLQPAFYEALLRMKDESGDLVTIGSLIPIAEKIGFIDMIDSTALTLAVQELESYPSISLSVNVSSVTLQQPQWVRQAIARLHNKNIASRLILEITETFEYHELAPIADAVAQFKALGCRIALDDFGAGHTSLAQLHILPVDIIKIDGTFVQDMLQRNDHFIFVQTITELAHRLGLKTVAEFVETAPVTRAATSLKVDYMQGHCFASATVTRPWLQ